MFPEDVEVTAGMRVLHIEGLYYEVEDVRRTTENYEVAHVLGGRVVNYTQLEDGGYPAGTKWSKDEVGFRQFFTPAPSAE